MTLLSTSAFYERANAGSFRASQARGGACRRRSQLDNGSTILLTIRSRPRACANFARRTISSRSTSSNANRATSDLTLADSAIQEIADNLIRAQELATQAATGTLNDGQRTAIGEQIANIRSNLVALANSKDSFGHALFGGEASGDAYTLDAGGNPVYSGTASAGELALGDGQSVIARRHRPGISELLAWREPDGSFRGARQSCRRALGRICRSGGRRARCA